MMCLGLNWDPETRSYERKRVFDESETPSIPREFSLLVERAMRDSQDKIEKESSVENVEEILPGMSPDICIVNFYTTTGRLGLHQVGGKLLFVTTESILHVISLLHCCIKALFGLMI